MKTKAEIEEMIAAHEAGIAKPCDCHLRGPQHTMQCEVGGALMRSAANALKWALGKTDGATPAEMILTYFRAR